MRGEQRPVRVLVDTPGLAWDIEHCCREAGFAVETRRLECGAERPDRPAERDDGCATLVESSDLRGLVEVRRAARGSSDAAVIAVVPTCTASWFITAFKHGATAVLPCPIDSEALIHTLLHASAGNAVIPSRIAAEIATQKEANTTHVAVTGLEEADVRLLRLLCSDQTISSISRNLRVSERTLYRRVRVLCHRLGASTRVELVKEATQLGLA